MATAGSFSMECRTSSRTTGSAASCGRGPLAAPRSSVVRRSIHGVNVELRADAMDAAALIERRVEPFPRSLAEPDVVIEVVTRRGEARHEPPPDLRVVHKSAGGSIGYDDAEDELWAVYGSDAVARCATRRRRAWV